MTCGGAIKQHLFLCAVPLPSIIIIIVSVPIKTKHFPVVFCSRRHRTTIIWPLPSCQQPNFLLKLCPVEKNKVSPVAKLIHPSCPSRIKDFPQVSGQCDGEARLDLLSCRAIKQFCSTCPMIFPLFLPLMPHVSLSLSPHFQVN